MRSIDDLILKNKVVIFSKSTCPFCMSVKNFFNGINVEFDAYESDKGELTDKQIEELQKKTNLKTYPNVFVGLTNTGGYFDTMNLSNSGELYEIMDKCGIKYTKNE